jgi:DNA-binding MarR family transcriptional regulator
MGHDTEFDEGARSEAEDHSATEDLQIQRGLRAIVLLHRAFEQGARKVGVSIPQYRLLLFLRHGPRRAGELAASAAVKRPTLTALVAGMEKERWIRRVEVEADRRGVALELTPKGRDVIAALETRLGGMVDLLSKGGDRDRLLGGLEEMADIVAEEVKARIRSYRDR